MIEEMMKAVKRSNKRRSVNITIGAVVGFLLSSTVVMGAAAVEIIGDSTDFKVTTTEITGNTLENNIYTNNGEIKPAQGVGGVYISGRSTDNKLSVVNNGTINGKLGIYTEDAQIKGDIINNGNIETESDSIQILRGTIEGNIINNGVIESKGSSISLAGTIKGDTVNNGTIEAKTIGINIATGSVVTGDVVNTGVIESEGSSISSSGTLTGELINNGTISSLTGNGISVAGKLTAADKIAIENNGTIEAKTIGINVVSGAVVTGNIVNNGIINRENNNNTIVVWGKLDGNIINKGAIDSKTISPYDNASIHAATMTGNIENVGVITTTNGTSGVGQINSGIYSSKGESLTGNIGNTGLITSINPAQGDASGLFLGGTLTGNIENKGSLISKGVKESHGVIEGATGALTKSTISNYGYMDVESSDGVGAGIQVKDTSGIKNYGRIRVGGSTESKGIALTGTSKFDNNGLVNSENGFGAYIGSSAASRGSYNHGVIYGKTNAIKNDGTIGLSNFGLLINQGEDGTNILSGTDFKTIINYGLAFSVQANGNYYLNDDNKQIYPTKSRTVINAKSFEGTTSGEITGTESILSSLLTTDSADDYGNTKNQYVMNGINDTLVVDDIDKKLSGDLGSIVNAYGRAMVMKKGSEFIAEQTIFNGGVDGKSETIYLSGNNVLNLSGNSVVNGNTKIDGTGNTFTMNASIQNGDIEANGGSNTLSLKNGSIMNGETKIKGDSNTLEIAEGSIINGDITATGDKNELTLTESILNGNVTIDGDGNTLNISEKDTYINGNLAAANGKNTLNFTGDSTTGDNFNMFHEVTGFNEMNIKGGSVTFFEDSKVTGTEKVTIAEDGTLNLRLKKTGIQTGTGLNEATHAFTANGEMVMVGEGDGGNLKFITSGIGEGVWIDIDDIQLKNIYVTTGSAIDGYFKVEEDGGLVIKAADDLEDMQKSGDKIEDSNKANLFKEGIFDEENFESINGIYKGIRSSTNKNDNLDALRNVILFDRNSEIYDENTLKSEQLKNLQAYLNEIYTQSPYALSSELSRKSAGMFRDIVVGNIFRPNLNQWMIMGGLTHIDGGTKDTYYGEVYKLDGKNSLGTKVDAKLTGAYALGKYGYSENVTLGVTVGGNRSEAELSRSKVKGNSGYVGAFAENYRGNLTLKAGAGVQYSEYDADRATIGGYSYSDKYSGMTYDIYLNGRYSNPIGDNLFLEPYATLSYTYVDQEGTDEGNKALAITTDSKSFDYTAAKVGVDLKKVIPHEKGKSTLSAGASYTRLLNGADADSLTGSYKGGSDFDIMVASKNEHSVGLNTKYALEMESGVLFDVKGSYSFERDSHNGNARNKNKGEWIVGAGLGYKF